MNILERQAFDLGWDFATFGVNVPEEANLRFCEGYRAFLHGRTKARKKADKYVKKWLQIRFGALARRKQFSLDVTPEYLRRITPASGVCPVTGLHLTFGECEPTDWSVDRANNSRGYVRGNIIIVSAGANTAKGDKSLAEMQALARGDHTVDGLTPSQWQEFSNLVAPAFGEGEWDMNPVQVLSGQSIALGMPVSPIASFQVAVSRALIDGWNRERREAALEFIGEITRFIIRTPKQRKAMHRLINEILRRSRHLPSYTEIWKTKRIQRRLQALLDALGSPGLRRLSELQEAALGRENTRLA